jgi:hypothetical protein
VIERGKLNRPALVFFTPLLGFAAVIRAFLVMTAVGVVGCSPFARVVRPPPQPLQLTTVFLYPPAISGVEVSGGRKFELAQRSCDRFVLEAGDALALFGPTEFRVIRPELEDAWVATDAIPTLVKSGSRPDQGAALKVSVERRVASGSIQAESLKGQPRGTTSTEETTWLVRAELSHPSSRTTLFEISGQVTVDPFQTPPPEAEWDEAPALTKLVEQLVTQAARHARRHAAERTVAHASALVFTATPAASSLLPGGAAGDGAEALQREIALQNRARVLAPTATEPQAGALARALPGTFVLSGTDGKLAPGDVVIAVDQQPALPHVLARLRFKGAPGELEVKRASGATESVVWP